MGDILRILYLTLAIIIVGGSSAGQLYASDSRQLETRLWEADHSQLPALEADIIREIQHQPSSAYYHYLLTNLYLRRFLRMPAHNQWLQQALKLAQQTIYLDANSELGYLALADIYSVVGKSEQAQDVFRVFTYRTAIKRSWRYFLFKAKIFLSDDTVDNSLSLLQRALYSEGALHEIVIPYIVVILDAKYGNNKQAKIATVRKWQQRVPHQLFDQYLAMLHINTANYGQAWQIYATILNKYPNNREARRNRAIISYRYMQQDEIAKQELQSLLASATNSELETSVINLHLGIIYLRRDMLTQAQQSFLNALSHYDEHNTSLEIIVNAYKEQQKFHQLAKFLEQLNVEKPGNASYYGLLGDVWTEYIGDYRRAAAAYENAIVLDPHNGRLYSALGMARYRLHEFEQALLMFGKARTIDSLDATAFYNEACIYALLSRGEEAISSLQRAIELDASLREHAREDSDFDKIRQMPAFINVTN